jgi:RHS repeat-associated protein
MATSRGTISTTAYCGGLAESINGALSYLLTDGLGSVSMAVSAASGNITATQLYEPYGAVRYQSGTLPTSKGYTGQRADAATSGLDYYGARYYDPVAGQFTSADTLLPQSVAQPDPGQLNRYAYVAGNPETKTDASGHCPMCVTAAIGAAAGFLIGFGGDVALQLAANNGNWQNVDWGTALKYGAGGAVAGALVGLLGPAGIGLVSYGSFGAGFGIGAVEGALESVGSGETSAPKVLENALGSGIAAVIGTGVGSVVGTGVGNVVNNQEGWPAATAVVSNSAANGAANTTAQLIAGQPANGQSVLGSFIAGAVGGGFAPAEGPWIQAGAVGVIDLGLWWFSPHNHGNGSGVKPLSPLKVAHQGHGRSRAFSVF